MPTEVSKEASSLTWLTRSLTLVTSSPPLPLSDSTETSIAMYETFKKGENHLILSHADVKPNTTDYILPAALKHFKKEGITPVSLEQCLKGNPKPYKATGKRQKRDEWVLLETMQALRKTPDPASRLLSSSALGPVSELQLQESHKVFLFYPHFLWFEDHYGVLEQGASLSY